MWTLTLELTEWLLTFRMLGEKWTEVLDTNNVENGRRNIEVETFEVLIAREEDEKWIIF